jgi:hypothetical protein
MRRNTRLYLSFHSCSYEVEKALRPVAVRSATHEKELASSESVLERMSEVSREVEGFSYEAQAPQAPQAEHSGDMTVSMLLVSLALVCEKQVGIQRSR